MKLETCKVSCKIRAITSLRGIKKGRGIAAQSANLSFSKNDNWFYYLSLFVVTLPLFPSLKYSSKEESCSFLNLDYNTSSFYSN